MSLTAIIIIATVVILIAYDIFAVIKWGVQGTLSVVAYNAAKKYPMIPLWAGILIGHLFIPPPSHIYEVSQLFPFIPFVSGVAIGIVFTMEGKARAFLQKYPITPFMIGVFCGPSFASLVI